MGTLLRNQRVFCAISIFFCILISNLHSFGTSVKGIEVSNDRTISSNNEGFFIQRNKTQEKHAYFETTKSLPFVIPSYASGILDPKSTPIASNVSPPSQFLLPPVVTNAFETITKSYLSENNTTILNSNEPETTTALLPLTPQFSSTSVTKRSNFDGKIYTIQPKILFVSTQKPESFTPFIPKTKSTTLPTPTSKTTTSATITTVTKITKTTAASTQSSSFFTTKFGETFETSTLASAFGLGFRQSRRDDDILNLYDILGNQAKPGYAIRPDGSVDPEAIPPEFIKPTSSAKFTTAKPTTTATIPIPRTSSPTTTTTKFIATTNVSKNLTPIPWLQQATSFQQTIPFFKPNSKPLITSTKSNHFPTTTDFPLETTIQSFSKNLVQFPDSSPSKTGVQNVFNQQNENVFGSGIRDRSMVVGTTLSSNTMKTTTQDTKFFDTQMPASNRSHNNSNKSIVAKSFTKPQSINSNSPISLSGSSIIQLPNLNLLPPSEENIQPPISLQRKTTLPPKKFPTIFSTFSSARFPINTQDQSTSNIQYQHESSSTDLLPPTTANVKFDTINEVKPNDILPQLDLNPFLTPFLESAQNSKTTKTTTSPSLPTTTIKNTQVLLQDSSFSYKKPAVPFIIQANVHGIAQQQQPFQPNIKYTGSFGAPPGILTPYDNLG